MRVALLLVVAACSKDPPSNEMETPGKSHASDVLTGTLRIGETPVTLKACRPGRTARVFVEVVTSGGRLRFEDTHLYWSPELDSKARGDQLACDQLDRSWGGGNRADGTSYWRGSLTFMCMYGKTPIAGMLTLDCGKITAEERAQLDSNRKEMQEDQHQGAGSGSAP